MKRFLKWLLSPVVLGTLGLLALSAVIWWVGPLVAIGSARPLDGFWTRVIVLVVLWLLWIARIAWVAWRRKKANEALLQGIAAGPTAADKEAQVLAQRFSEAVAKLKASGGKKGSLLGGSDTLYDLPWYVFVGAPGSGKTTALLNAGLNFLLTEEGGAVKGVGGTRNCDWWFTRDAVLIDTAGRYTLQESDKDVDASAWDNFLSLLRRTRPRRPINGVLLTVNVQDLLQQGATERKEHAAKLRARLHELQTKLGVRPPIYTLVTKADLIAGFNESFEALGKEERDQVWGFTFPTDTPADQPLRDLDTQYKALEERLNGGLFERLQAERDVGKRAAMFGFAQEFAALKPVLADFLGQVFGSGGTLEDRVVLRGVYFTSGTQEGTPIDRVMGALSRSFGLERKAAAAGAGQRGKSFFLRRLMQEVVFAEAHLVSFNPKAERQRLVLRVAGFAAVAVASVALIVGWAVSYVRNKAYEAEVAARLPALKQAVEALPPATAADPTPLAAPLAAVRNAALPEGFPLADPPLLNGLGLYQGDKLDAAAQIGHRNLLNHALAPRLAKRLEERLRAANKDNLEQAYEALKGYLMLYTPEQFDADTLKAWISVDWDQQFKSLPEEQRRQLDAHLDAFLAQGAPKPSVAMDAALVTSVRDMLASFPLEYRIYSRLKRQFRGELPDFSVASAAGPQGPNVFVRASREPLSRGVSGFYTKAGYARAFQGGAATKAAAQLGSEEQWIFGRPGNAAAGAAKAAGNLLGTELTDKVRRLYLEDYIKNWDAFLADVKLIKLDSVARSVEVTRILSSPVDSPMVKFLRAAAEETTLVPPVKEPSVLDKAAAEANKAKSDIAKMVDPGAAPTLPSQGPVEKMVDDHFANLRRMVTGQPAPVDELAKTMAALAVTMQAVAAKAPPPPGGPAPAQIKADAAQLPEPAKSALAEIGDNAAQLVRGGQIKEAEAGLKPITEFCNRAVAGRYPFAASSRSDVPTDDFGSLFGAGGLLDEFFNRNLAAQVDTGTNPWSYRPSADGSKPASAAALADFQRAQRIRDVFFRAGGKAPGFRLDIRASEIGAGLTEVTLDIDGKPIKFTPGNTAPVTLSWPPAGVTSQIKLSAQPAAPTSGPTVFDGPWALFRLFERFEVQPGPSPEKFRVIAILEGKRVVWEVTASSAFNPFRMREIQQFRCPSAL